MSTIKTPILLLLFLVSGLQMKAQEVNFFQGSLKEAQASAIESGKPLLIYMTADWCGYCLYTENNVFKSDTAYEYLNENYICVKVKEKSKDTTIRKFELEKNGKGHRPLWSLNSKRYEPFPQEQK